MFFFKQNLFKRIREKGFLNSIVLLSSSSAINIILNIVLAPIVSRIYNKEDYGAAALFISVVTVMSVFTTLMYPSAIIIPSEERKAEKLASLSFILTICFSLITFIALLIFYLFDLETFSSSAFDSWIYLIPIGLIILVLDQIATQFNFRLKDFKRSAKANVVSGVSNKGVTIAMGLIFGSSQFGLLIGFLGSHIISFFIKARNRIQKILSINWNKQELLTVANEYSSYPKYILPGDLINRLSRDFPLYFFSYSYDLKVVGSLAFANSMLSIPYNLISTSISPVFIQKAKELKEISVEKLKQFLVKLNNLLFLLGVLPFSILTVFGEEIFAIVFSENWREAGVFAGILAIYFMFRIIMSPLSSIFRVLEKEKITLVFNIFLFVGRALLLWISSLYFSAINTLIFYSVFSAFAYFILLIITFNLVKLQWFKYTMPKFLAFFLTVLVLFSIKQLIF
jgi:O-antigen/teichoic acid export membrane protein